MTDGPFRNAALSREWKRYGDDLISDAASPEERAVKAFYSMLNDVDLAAFSILWRDLNNHMQCRQLDLDPVASVEAIFDNNPKSTLVDTFQKELEAELRAQTSSLVALDKALINTAKFWISITKSRLDDQCICARELGDMSRDDFHKGIQRNEEAFSRIKLDDFCSALVAGTKRGVGKFVEKKIGIDEGPDE